MKKAGLLLFLVVMLFALVSASSVQSTAVEVARYVFNNSLVDYSSYGGTPFSTDGETFESDTIGTSSIPYVMHTELTETSSPSTTNKQMTGNTVGITIAVWYYVETFATPDFIAGGGVVSGWQVNNYGDGSNAVRMMTDGTNRYSSGGVAIINTGTWHWLVWDWNLSATTYWYDNVYNGTGGGALLTENTIFLNSNVDTGLYGDTRWYCLRAFNGTLTQAERDLMYNNSNGDCTPLADLLSPPPPPPPPSGNFSLNVSDAADFSAIVDVSANITLVGGSSELYVNSTGNLIITGVLTNSSDLINISITGAGYLNQDYLNVNVSDNLAATLDKTRFNVTYVGNISFNSTHNYVRLLNYTVGVSLCYNNNTLDAYVNGVLNASTTFICADNSSSIDGSYLHGSESFFNLSFELYGANSTNVSSVNVTFIADLINPNITLNHSVAAGFFATVNFTINLNCWDGVYENLAYNLSANAVSLFSGNFSSGTMLSNTTDLLDGANNLTGVCSDLFGSTSKSIEFTAYSRTIVLWDEVENVEFNIDNVTQAKLWFGDNASFYDFKGGGNSNVTYVSMNVSTLRLELEYAAGGIVVRFVDAELTAEDEDLKLCANKEGVTHYEQLIISAIERPVVVRNTFSNCYIAADNTKFAYQDAFLLKAYSINSLYYLYTFDEGNQVLLASVDGSIATYINLDTLEFSREGYNIDILADALVFAKTGDFEVTLYYRNLNGDNEALSMTITRLDDNTVVFTTSTFADPNTFTLIFDYSTLSNVTSDTLFLVALEKTDADGVVETIQRYFNTSASTGVIVAGVAFAVAFLMTVFGLTFAAVRITFSWFGIIIMIGSIAVLSFAIPTWYVILLQAINVIVLIYIILTLVKKQDVGVMT